jgi:magnesium-transporting ATPase (P-type)
MIFSGTLVTTGGCIAVVVSTGEMTEIGKINKNIIKAKEGY